MKNAVKIFDKYLKLRDQGNVKFKHHQITQDEIKSEKEQRKILSRSDANKHGRRFCKTDSEFGKYAKDDKNHGLNCLREGGKEFYKEKFVKVSNRDCVNKTDGNGIIFF